MQRLSSAELEAILKRDFPVNALCWSQAGDEVRDMCRGAREMAGLAESVAVDFRAISSPAQWNQQGIAGTVRFYEKLSAKKQQEFCERFESLLT